jgi:hypothetical protein
MGAEFLCNNSGTQQKEQAVVSYKKTFRKSKHSLSGQTTSGFK